jgi:hypothetical protein
MNVPIRPLERISERPSCSVECFSSGPTIGLFRTGSYTVHFTPSLWVVITELSVIRESPATFFACRCSCSQPMRCMYLQVLCLPCGSALESDSATERHPSRSMGILQIQRGDRCSVHDCGLFDRRCRGLCDLRQLDLDCETK